ncbi:RNA-binding domain-containing protein [Gymnopus androsaceus JB14]|uniref:RNA-binding domain-containing protein n=1 Tax=Gymnopus androsaceus JB14 TaxID=1447944 RepID=A0A6A4IIE5_9AGAR|nr:RNA-binding domain-containing protein [Gymnopus androsaceus JB14]
MSDAPAAQVTENGAPPATQEAPGFKVFAGNLAYTTTDEGLKAFFAPVESDIITAQVILRGTRSAGYGFVALSSAEAAQKAVDALDKQPLDGRPVIVELAKQADQKDKEKKEKKTKRRPGRRGSKAVPGEVSEAEASGDASKAEDAAGTGDAEKPKKKKKKSARKSKAKAEGDATEGDVTEAAAPATDAAPKKPRQRKPQTPRTPRPAGEAPKGDESKTVLFVANLGFNIDDAGLAALFTEAGIAVTSARIVRRRWGHPRRSKGYGFVDVGGEEEQKKAIEALQGKEVGGRPIAVKIAINTPHDEEAAEAAEAAPPTDRELEAREEGLSKSLLERAKEEEDGSGSKGLSIMMKMGFLPGRSLGRPLDDGSNNNNNASKSEISTPKDLVAPSNIENRPRIGNPHRTEPLPISEWTGKEGIGTSRKRGLSPTAAERIAKMAKMAEDSTKEDFRDRARREYEERRAEGRLGPAQGTCATLDEKSGILFNVLWLNLGNPNTFPHGLTETLALHTTLDIHSNHQEQHLDDSNLKTRLQKQMKSDALRPISDELDSEPIVDDIPEFSQDTLQEAEQFLRLQSQDRLKLVVSYLRDRYSYCFWCGTQYDDQEDMESNCPGPDEESHD